MFIVLLVFMEKSKAFDEERMPLVRTT
jgi:hypothetical protein